MGTRVDPKNKSSRESSVWDRFSLPDQYIPGGSTWNKLLLLALICLFLFIAYDFYRFATSSNRFRTTLHVEGNRAVSIKHIRTTLRPIIGKSDNHRSLLQVSVQAVRNTLRRRLPRLKNISVRKQFPNKLHISVKERTPVALIARLQEKGSRIYLPIDSDGVMFTPTVSETKTLPEKLPVIRGMEETNPDHKPFDRTWDRAMRVIRAVKDNFSIDVVNWIQIVPGGYVKLQINRPKNVEVRLGLDAYDEKLQRLHKMMQTSQFPQIEKYVDLSDLDNIRVL